MQPDSQLHKMIPFIHENVVHRDQGLFCEGQIPPNTIILQIQTSNAISNKPHNKMVDIPELNKEKNPLIFKILYLKKMIGNDHPLYEWVNSTTSGFLTIDPEIMRESNDDNLQIQYCAYRNYIDWQAHSVFFKHSSLFEKIYGISTVEQFVKSYVWASQFRNTRAFGYTRQTFILPFIDYMNFDPSQKHQKVQFVTYDSREQIPTVIPVEEEGESDKDSSEDSSNSNIATYAKKYMGILTTSHFQKGEQIYFFYGSRSNKYLFQWYGYTVRGNPYDRVIIYISKFKQEKMIFFTSIERGTKKFELKKKQLNWQLLQFWVEQLGGTIQSLIYELQKIRPPLMNESQSKKEEAKYLLIYQQEQFQIYKAHIALLVEQRQY